MNWTGQQLDILVSGGDKNRRSASFVCVTIQRQHGYDKQITPLSHAALDNGNVWTNSSLPLTPFYLQIT